MYIYIHKIRTFISYISIHMHIHAHTHICICIYVYIYIQSLRTFRLSELSGLLGMHLGIAEGSLGETRTSWNGV